MKENFDKAKLDFEKCSKMGILIDTDSRKPSKMITST